jgi:protein-disulfide isomerase
MTPSRRQFLLTGGAAATAGLAGCLGGNGTNLPDEVPSTAVTGVPIPDSPGDHDYETMGTADAPTLTYYGNWKCPHCATFSTGALNELAADYVEPGDLNLEFRALILWNNDDVRAAQAGHAVWNVDPERYWTFHEYVMANQPSSSKEWATTNWLTTAAEKVGVEDVDAVKSQIQDGAYTDLIERTSSEANSAGFGTTPTLAVDGRRLSHGGESLPQNTRDTLNQLAGR